MLVADPVPEEFVAAAHDTAPAAVPAVAPAVIAVVPAAELVAVPAVPAFVPISVLRAPLAAARKSTFSPGLSAVPDPHLG